MFNQQKGKQKKKIITNMQNQYKKNVHSIRGVHSFFFFFFEGGERGKDAN